MDRAIALYPLDARGYLEGANVSFLLYDRTKNDDYLQHSIDLMQGVIKLDPYNAVRYGNLAMFYYAQNKQDLAGYYVEYGLSLDNQNLPSWVLLARVLQLVNNIKGSRGALDHAYKLAPNNELVREMYLRSQKVADDQYSKFSIPILYNPDQIE